MSSITQQDVDNLERAISSGELQVRKGDRWITYRSIEELKAALSYAKSEVAKKAGGTNKPNRSLILGIDRGL